MASSRDSEVEKLKGTWDYIDGENFDDFMKELVEFNETRADGAEVKGTITFSNGRWVHKAVDKDGKVAMVERYIDEKGQQQVVMTCGKVTAKRWYKRV
ncbi:unnamed protein product [Didymodactylos carnosus]|uniref:Cytosolic fatty-acid binding proteins domain-containing protein n=1 Tax=Didymodactylos carnosus TaxID=1234261 RepID=A0A8S2DRB0_9BILA|nr:unnamed protein product [Didymodactylos carnosus]CAF3780837.1 unnamed protein product [Didymodactylos carnosus]